MFPKCPPSIGFFVTVFPPLVFVKALMAQFSLATSTELHWDSSLAWLRPLEDISGAAGAWGSGERPCNYQTMST